MWNWEPLSRAPWPPLPRCLPLVLHVTGIFKQNPYLLLESVSVYSSGRNEGSDSHSTNNKMHLLAKIIYSCNTLYRFRTVFPFIIRSSKLRIQQRYLSTGDQMELQFHLTPLATGSSSCLTYTVAVCAVLSSWWWTERPFKTCRAFTRINNLR